VDEETLLRRTAASLPLSLPLRRPPATALFFLAVGTYLARTLSRTKTYVPIHFIIIFLSFLLCEPAKVLLGWLGGSLARSTFPLTARPQLKEKKSFS
jgi:hypothetical protein